MKIFKTATVLSLALATWGCHGSDMTTAERVSMANPASVNCIKVGGKLILQSTSPSDVGMCQLPSGKVCEQWALFRGECL